MKYSAAGIRTLKEAPADADSVNARFLTQGGFVKRELAGVYSFLPLGKRILQKIERIIREEMWSVDSVEVGMPAMTPLENWIKTGRDQVDIAYHPTESTILAYSHEEIVTPMAKEFIQSWKDLPLSLFQIQTKFRNEPRAKSGILRGREFSMKDAYSFHSTQEDLDTYYQSMLEAYLRVYKRCGLTAYAIEASGGIFTDKISHEFAVITPAGEDIVIFEESEEGLGNPQNAEIAVGNPPLPKALEEKAKEEEKPLEEKDVDRPKTISGTAQQYEIEEWEILKTVVLHVEQGEDVKLVGISIRGDLDVNMHKVMSFFQTEDIWPATSEELEEAGLAEGYISPIQNTTIEFYGDESVKKMKNFNTGANAMNRDYFNANIDRDANLKAIHDFVLVEEGFSSRKTGNLLKAAKCVEVGNIFDLGTKYSEAFDLKFTTPEGKAELVLMGCYGIGVSRLMGTVAETFFDDKGVIWPKSVAPYHVIVIPLGKSGTPEYETAFAKAEELEKSLQEKGVEVLLDNREESPGKKFADADLIGIPLRIVVSPRTLEKNSVEWKERAREEAKNVPLSEVTENILTWMKS